ncbi:tetratricopeptide repeat protein [Rubritalea spongiae]|uniref:Tetratricopeptide repeat protein n=1 Tax=Rubritalea spongiae TaxID=430797 RepID=A0ABW5E2E5_9BACT
MIPTFKESICYLTAIAGIAPAAFAGEPLPVSKEYWNDPSFVSSFNGSYKINARIEPTVSSEQRAMLVQVQERMKKGLRESALSLLVNSSLTKSSAALLYNRGNIELELGKSEEAIKSYKLALERFPSFRRAFKNLGTAYIQLSEYDEAEKALREAVKLGELDGSTLGLLGYCYLQNEQYASALQAYKMAQLTEPDVIDWKAGLAQCLGEVGDDEEALALLKEVVEARPTETSYQLLLVNIQLKLELEEDAIAGLELLRKQGLLEGRNLSLLASLYLRDEDLRMAKPVIAELQKSLSAESVASFLRTINEVVTIAEWEYAGELLEVVSAVDKNSKDQNTENRIKAFVLIQKGEEGAVELLEKVLESDPLDGEALLMLAGVKAGEKDYEHAALLYERAEKIPAVQYRALVESAKVLVTQKRYKSALQQLIAAQELQPSDSLEKYLNAVESLAKSW